MESVLMRDLLQGDHALAKQLAGREITVSGWIRSIRDSKALGFIVLHDGTAFEALQIVYEEGQVQNFTDKSGRSCTGSEAFHAISHLSVGSAIVVTGKLVLTPEAKQPFELHACTVELEGASAPDYPMQKKRHSMEFLRTVAHLRPRTNTFQAVFRVRSLAAFAIHKFFQERGFVYVHTPIITGSDAEGAGEMFRVTTQPFGEYPLTEDGKPDTSRGFFGKATNLTVSGQLNGET